MLYILGIVALVLIAACAVVLSPELAGTVARVRRSLPGRAGAVPAHPRYGAYDTSAPTYAIRPDGLVTVDPGGDVTVIKRRGRHTAGLPRRLAQFEAGLTRPMGKVATS